MPIPFDQAQASINQLVKQFKTNLALYHAPTYKEASARQEFIDKMFVYLGWDVYNEEQAAPQYRDVEVEPTQDVEGEKKAPDYVFRIGKEKKFFVEAKKPGVSIKTDARPAYQVRRYAWSAKLPLSLLTDFEELAVYDCRTRPSITDQASVARINFFTFDQYPDRWRELWDVFSREAVRGGSFDQYIDQTKGKRGTATVDAEFLKEIEGWRETLARNIAIRNPKLSIDEMNDAVQRTIDRIIFLRMAEDRGIEAQDRLKQLTLIPGGIYAGLLSLFRQADAKYNSGLFDFNADQLTAKLSIDDKVLKPIIADLYYPQPYEFSVMPAEILGNVYEQFLGKVIRLTAAHQAKVEEKPEVKKAGGVYYTPAYIVDYIVQHTVGQMIEGKTPRQLQSFRVLDMACGSGSFLLGAYQYLLDYYLKWYIDHLDPSGLGNPKGLVRIGDDWRLTTAERKRILLTHIFGVDIDRQAVEVTKLSLLLKVLEGENEQSLQMELIVKERALPNLDANIKCGNSLIGPDYFEDRPSRFLETSKVSELEELRRVNPFDWQSEFPDAMRAGGFDCVIGNPPYGIIFAETNKKYLEDRYPAFVRNDDMYVAFTQRAISLLRVDALFGFIIPNTYLLGPYFDDLKSYILAQSNVLQIVDFGNIQVFPKPNVFTSLLFLQRKPAKFDAKSVTQFAKVVEPNSFPNSIAFQPIVRADLSSLHWTPANTVADKLLRTDSVLDKFAWVKDVGLNYWTEGRGKTRGGSIADRVLYNGTQQNSKDKPYLKGRDIERYSIVFGNHWLRHDYQKRLDPKVDTFRFSPEFLEQEKIIYRQTADHIIAALELDGFLNDKTVHVVIFRDDWKERYDLRYILGLLNSHLMSYLYQYMAQEEGRTFAQVKIFRVKQLPIRPIDFTNPQDKARHDRMVSFVEKMLALHQQLPSAKTAADRDLIQRQIDATDRSIDQLVYELYGLTAEEIKIVEGA